MAEEKTEERKDYEQEREIKRTRENGIRRGLLLAHLLELGLMREQKDIDTAVENLCAMANQFRFVFPTVTKREMEEICRKDVAKIYRHLADHLWCAEDN